MAKAILKDVSKGKTEKPYRGIAWFQQDGSLNANESMDRAVAVLEFLAHVDGVCDEQLELEGRAKDGRWLILEAVIGTIEKCEAVRRAHG